MSKWINIGITDKGKILVFKGKRCEPKQLIRLDNFESDGIYFPILNIEGTSFDDLIKIKENVKFMLQLFKKTLENEGYIIKKKDASRGEINE